MAWYNASWTYRKKITIASSQVPSTQSNFPIYVDLSDLGSDFFTNVKTDGSDIRVTTSDETTEVPIDVISIDTSGQTGRLQFKATSLSSSTDTEFYIYYGNSSATAYSDSDTNGKDNVYDSSIRAFYNFDSDANDSTSNGKDLTVDGATTTSSGKLGSAYDYDGTNDKLRIAESDAIHTDTSGMVIVSINMDNLDTDYATIWSTADESTNNRYVIAGVRNNGFAFIQMAPSGSVDRVQSTTNAISAGTYAHIAFISTDTAYEIMVNGTNTTLSTTVGSNSGRWFGDSTGRDSFTLGMLKRNSEALHIDGKIDEVLIVNSTSQDFVSVHYNNTYDTSNFYTIGTQETDSAALSLDLDLTTISTSAFDMDTTIELPLDLTTISVSGFDVTVDSSLSLDLDLTTVDVSVFDTSFQGDVSLDLDLTNVSTSAFDLTFSSSSDLSLDLDLTTISTSAFDMDTTIELPLDLVTIDTNAFDVSLDSSLSLDLDLTTISTNAFDLSVDSSLSLDLDLTTVEVNAFDVTNVTAADRTYNLDLTEIHINTFDLIFSFQSPTSIMTDVLADFGTTYKVLRPAQEIIFAGHLNYDSENVVTNNYSLVVIKRYETNTQIEVGVHKTLPAYAVFRESLDIVERDLIIVKGQTFIVREVTARHNNIGGQIGTEAQYKKAELDLYYDGDVTA